MIDEYYRVFGSNEFMLHHSQGLPWFATKNTYFEEEESFMKTVRKVHISSVPIGSNVLSSHVLYKVKTLNDGSRKIKARIAPHGNKDRDRNKLKTDSAVCTPVGIRVLSFAVIKGWKLCKIDFKSAFLQPGLAERNVYVVPPRECETRSFYWLLLTAAYGLVNASAKWQEEIGASFIAFGFTQLVYILQLFHKNSDNGCPGLIAVKVVDDVLLTGPPDKLGKVVEELSKKYKIGTIVYSPASFLFNGLQISQDEDGKISVDADEKLNSLRATTIDRCRRKQYEETANDVELYGFRSIAGSLGWIGVTASPFCALAASTMQQKGPGLSLKNIIDQGKRLKMLQNLGTSSSSKRPEDKGTSK